MLGWVLVLHVLHEARWTALDRGCLVLLQQGELFVPEGELQVLTDQVVELHKMVLDVPGKLECTDGLGLPLR